MTVAWELVGGTQHALAALGEEVGDRGSGSLGRARRGEDVWTSIKRQDMLERLFDVLSLVLIFHRLALARLPG